MGCEPLTLAASKVDLLGLLVAVGDRDAIAMAGVRALQLPLTNSARDACNSEGTYLSKAEIRLITCVSVTRDGPKCIPKPFFY